MKNDMTKMLRIVAIIGVVAVAGCCKKSDSEPPKTAGVGERTGAALDKAAEKTKDVAGKVVEKTGEALQKAGAATERTGENMQK